VALKHDVHRTILVPPEIRRSFWVEDGRVSPEYLEEMGLFLANLYFNVAPNNVTSQQQMLLRYVAPEAAGVLKAQSGAYALRLTRENAATTFTVGAITADAKHLRVAMHGLLSTWVANTRVSQAQKAYLFEFRLTGGRLLLTSARETDDKNPLGAAGA
jgi:conjugal transfer pilus assembly protein TraE